MKVSKQDRSQVRTPTDLERRYSFGKNKATVKESAQTAKRAAAEASAASEAAKSAAKSMTQEGVFNLLTGNGTLPCLVMIDGQMYVNVEYLTGATWEYNETLSKTILVKDEEETA